jgi:hypothetical protein
MTTSFITPGHVRAYQAVTSQIYGETTLASCYVNGEECVGIVLIEHVGEDKVAVMPLFVGVTPGMTIDWTPFEEMISGGKSGGGPKREFRKAAEAEKPSPKVA